MKEVIRAALDTVAQRHGVRYVLAVESGSRAWGFASTDSDYDVRFIYTRPLAWYLRVHDQRDVLEPTFPFPLDLSGWDLRKTCKLLCKSNAPLFEWLQSPIVYQTSEMADRLRVLAKNYFNPRGAIYSYLHMAEGNYRVYLQGDRVRTKKYFYVLRPLLACEWIERTHGVPPMEFLPLLDASVTVGPPLRAVIDSLLSRKKDGVELAEGPRIVLLNEWLDERISHFANSVRTANTPEIISDDLDELFFNAVTQPS